MRYACGLLILGGLAWAQDAAPERVTVPFSDAARPKTLKVTLMNGGITVKGYNGKEAIVEARSRAESESRRRERPERPDPKAQGLKRLSDSSTGLNVEERENVVTVGTGLHGMSRNMEISVQVPFDTSLHLKTMNGGDIVVDHVNGEIDANDMNGAVTITNVSGAVVAHSMNGAVTVSIDKVTPDKPMSFSSMNGDIDVTLPADTRANLKLKTENGEIYSDFELQTSSANKPTVTDNRKGGGRYRVQFDKGLSATLNGGGPEMQLTTFNGKIYLRKKK